MDYNEQKKINEAQFKEIIKATRPDIWAIMNLLEETKINWKVIFHVIRALGNVALDTKYGNIVIEVENNTVRFIRGTHNMKINELIMLPDLENTPDVDTASD